MIYFFLYAYILVCALYHDVYGHKRYFRFNYGFLYILFVLVAGLRYRLGTDTVGYMNTFDHEVLPLGQMDFEYVFSNRNQPFWVLLNSFCKSFGNFYLLQILISLILNTAIFIFLKKTFLKPFTALLLYFIINYLYFSMQILRESLAISCFLFAVLQLNKGSVIKYYLWSIAAFMFHFFAIFIFFIPIFVSRSISFKVRTVVLSSLLFIALLFQEKILVLFISTFPLAISSKILSYSQTDYYIEGNFNFNGIFIQLLFPLCFVLFGMMQKLNLIALKRSICKNIALLYIFLLISSVIVPITERFSNYLFIIMAPLFASLFYQSNLTKRSRAIVITFVSLLLVSYQVYFFSKVDAAVGVHYYAMYYPYASIFNETETSERTMYNNYWQDY